MDEELTVEEVIAALQGAAWLQRDCENGFRYLTDGCGFREVREEVAAQAEKELNLQKFEQITGWVGVAGQVVRPSGKAVWLLPNKTLWEALKPPMSNF